MKNSSGNIIIFFSVLLIILSILLILTLRQNIKTTDNESKQIGGENYKNIPQQTTLFETHSSTETQTLEQQKNYQYYNDISFISPTEILNPFLIALNNNPNPIQRDHLPNTDKLTRTMPANQITIAPNGISLPIKSSYLTNYPQSKNGNLNITINNIKGRVNILVFIYLNRYYAEPATNNKKVVTAAAYISAGDTFKFTNLKSGYYQIEWLDLTNKKLFQSNTFPIFQDNKFAYDHVFAFNTQKYSSSEFARELPLTALYK